MQTQSKVAIWRGVWGIFGWKRPPDGEFGFCATVTPAPTRRSRAGGNLSFIDGRKRQQDWIPACAGMTEFTSVARLTASSATRWVVTSLSAFLLTCSLALAANAQTPSTQPLPPQQFAELGECVLESGAVIADCKIGYVTLGKLNAARNNAILFPTFYGGNTGQIVPYLGPGKLIDTDKFFVIVVDSFGNGISSSPSNSAKQPGAAFPAMSIRDMVRQQKRMLDREFKLDRLHAVMGVSMGAMQAFEWAAWSPSSADKYVAIAGSPQLATYDLALWDTYSRLFRLMIDCQCQTPAQLLAGIRFLMNSDANAATPLAQREKVLSDIANAKVDLRVAHDRLLQLGAMGGHDVSRNTEGDMQKAALAVGNKLFVVVGSKDIVVTPGPALSFAKLAGAKTLELAACGHDIPRCQSDTINAAVNEFLRR